MNRRTAGILPASPADPPPRDREPSSSERFARGLVVGKFSPLHRGHELLVRTAMERCQDLCLISWATPERPGCEAAAREAWLAELFPGAHRLVLDENRLAALPLARRWPHLPHDEEPEDRHRLFCADLCLEELGGPVDAVFTSEGYGDGFAAVLTRRFREHDPESREVRHVCVDRPRRQVPVCASTIIEDVHLHRNWLPGGVYASFVERVCLLGAESTGKTTLAAALAERLGAEQVPEYGRTRWEEKNGRLAYGDLLAIGRRQVELEEAAARRAARFLVCDTSPLTTLFYSLALFGLADPRLEELARRRYRHVFLCLPDFGFVQDGTRQDPAFQERQHAWYLRQFQERGIPFHPLAGPLPRRLDEAAKALGLPRS